ncbi:MAG: TetR/AcrR family transcriptional regulator [Candidatus Neomarinimicrobiota bacterium]
MAQSKQDQRKNQIMDAALKVLIKNGYSQARMDDIVKVSGLSKGAIYWYYNSKKELYLDLINFWVQRYSVTLNHIVEEKSSASQQLRDLLSFFIDQYEADPEPFIALTEFWSMSQRDSDFKKKLQKVHSTFFSLVQEIVKYGVKTKEFKNLDISITALSIMVSVESINWFTLFDSHGVTAREYIQTIVDFILVGIVKKH